MKVNVFSETAPCGGVRIYSPVYEVEAIGEGMADAACKFVAALRAKNPFARITLIEAEPEMTDAPEAPQGL